MSILSIDRSDAEMRACLEPADTMTPERLFDRHWAMSLLRTAAERLEVAYREEGKERLFEHLKNFIETKRGPLSHREIAEKLTMSEGAVRAAVSRLRKRYRRLLMQEISGTLEEGASADEELQYLFRVFSAIFPGFRLTPRRLVRALWAVPWKYSGFHDFTIKTMSGLCWPVPGKMRLRLRSPEGETANVGLTTQEKVMPLSKD